MKIFETPKKLDINDKHGSKLLDRNLNLVCDIKESYCEN